jgi:putative oxidoreductase
MAIAVECFGGLGLIVGLLGRVAAFGIICNIPVAVVMVHWHFGLFMNWNGNHQGEGFEYHLLAIALGLALAVKGSRAFSYDRLLTGLSAQLTGSQLSC